MKTVTQKLRHYRTALSPLPVAHYYAFTCKHFLQITPINGALYEQIACKKTSGSHPAHITTPGSHSTSNELTVRHWAPSQPTSVIWRRNNFFRQSLQYKSLATSSDNHYITRVWQLPHIITTLQESGNFLR